jgi:autotransporter translocation and assembly factor TamB
VDGEVVAQLQHVDASWRATVDVSKGLVRVPTQTGERLKPVGAPPDLVFGAPRPPARPTHADSEAVSTRRRELDHPGLVAEIAVRDTKIEAREVRGDVSGKLRVLVDRRGVGILGNIGLDRGDLDLFGRRYNVERAALHFDGTTDPELDVRIAHDFPDVTTIAEVRGRMSKPEVQLSSRPSTYSQAELLAFLLGGEPGGDPNAPSGRERVEGAGASFVANKLGGYVMQALPIDIDVLRYESASAASSAAVTVGTWITRELFLAYRRHLEARPDENAGEGEIEYWLQRRLSLSGTIGDRGYSGVDLLWRRRW